MGAYTGVVSDSMSLRAGDSDRDRTIALLREAFAPGRLSDFEFHDRLALAAAARTFGELDALTDDLPLHAVTPAVVDTAELEHRRLARRNSWIAWLTTALIVTLVWLLTGRGDDGWNFFWPIWVIGPWGIVLLVRTVTNTDNDTKD